MPRTRSEIVFQDFSKGLHTESSAFKFPKDAFRDVDNIVLEDTGVSRRRYGMDYESGYTVTSTGLSEIEMRQAELTTFLWDRVNNDASITLGLIQIKSKLFVTNLNEASPSSAVLYTLDMNATMGGFNGETPLSYAALDGHLIVTAKSLPNTYRLNWTGSALTVAVLPINIRDRFGVYENVDVRDRPTTLTDTHKYNLYNRGWTQVEIDAVFTAKAVYPSLADVPYSIYTTAGALDATLLPVKDTLPNSEAPQGTYIIDARDRGGSRDTLANPITLPADVDSNNFSVVAPYAGRLFYAGLDSATTGSDIKSPNLTAMVLFSKLVSNTEDLSQCYQDADPTDENDSELVATDGGYLKLAGAGSIIAMKELQGRLLVFSTNGVWEIYGGEGEFAADSYVTKQITDVAALGSASILYSEEGLIYLAESGVTLLSTDPQSGRVSASNIIKSTIQSFYRSIPTYSKVSAVGYYDKYEGKARWLLGDYDRYVLTTNSKHRYNKELVLNTKTGAWTKHTLSSEVLHPSVAGFLPTLPTTSIDDTRPVVAGLDPDDLIEPIDNLNVIASVTDEFAVTTTYNVVATATIASHTQIAHKYITLVPNGSNFDWTISLYNSTDFVDWDTPISGGVDYISFIESGDITFDDVFRDKSVPHIYAHFNRTENGFTDLGNGAVAYKEASSCILQTRWAFSTSSNTGKYGKEQEIYRLGRLYVPSDSNDTADAGYEIISTKTKIRGKGKAVRFMFKSSTGKDFQLVAWGIPVEAGANI